MSTAFLVLAAVLLLVGLVVLAVALRARRRKRAAASRPGIDAAEAMRRVFSAARRLLKASAPGALAAGAVPRFLLLGEPGAGKSTLLAGAGLRPRYGPAGTPVGDAERCQIWLFDKAVIVEPAGGVIAGEGGARDHTMLRALLDAARHDRPERPMDGFLVALSARDLADAQDARRSAALVRRALEDARRLLGMQAPVHLLITQCDHLAGFQIFAEEIDPILRNALLGWSSPHPPYTPGSVDCVDEALAGVRDAVLAEQVRRLAADRPFLRASLDPDVGAEPYFLFTDAIDGLRDALRAYCEELFLAPEDGEPIGLRGIYFCGAGREETPAEPEDGSAPAAAGATERPAEAASPPAGASNQRPVLFAREVFERKIFAEANLARPSRAAVRDRERAILAFRVATTAFAILYAGLLAIEAGRMERHTASVLPFLHDLASHLNQAKLEEPGSDPSGALRTERSVQILEALGHIETERLRSLLVPSSWLSRIDDRIEDAITTAYEEEILDAVRVGLAAKTDPLLAVSPPVAPDAESAASTIERTPAYIVLAGWLRDVSAFEANVARFDALAAGPPRDATSGEGDTRLQHVAEISDYVFRHKLSPGRNTAYHRRALLRIAPLAPFGLEAYHGRARATSDRLFKNLLERVSITLNEAAVVDDMKALSQGLDALERGGPEYRTQNLADLHGAIVRTQGHLSAPTLAWVSARDLPPNPALERLFEAVRVSKLLGTTTHVEVRDDAEGLLRRLKTRLSGAETSLAGPLLARKEGDVQMDLSPFIVSLKEPSGGLLRQAFMEPTGEEDPLPDDLDGARLTWDLDALQQGVKLLKEYEAFDQGNGFDQFPEKVRGTVESLALRNLRDNVLVEVGKAARRESALPSSETRLVETVRADVASLALASPHLREILAAAGRLGLDDARDRLRALLSGQGARVLALAARVLQGDALYEVKSGSFAWWNGEGTPALEAFGVSDPARLAEFVVTQRGRADSLNRSLAEPVLSLLESAEVGAATQPVEGMGLWQGIAGALRDYENKKAGNSVASLEKFLIADLPAITFENCLLELDRAPVDVSAGDYFTQRRRHIRGLLRDQCAALAQEDIRTKYPRLRRSFNRSLAGRFPFAKLEPGVQHEDADPEDVRNFLQNVTDFRKRYRTVLTMRNDAAAPGVVRFLDKMEKVRAFLEPMWTPGESAHEGMYDVGVTFRVNQEREVDGNQIAEWSLRFADEQLTLGGAKSVTPWRIGDPARIQLRWAKNSVDIPTAEQDPGVTVRDRSVTFEERGPWALLRLIAAHRSSAEEPQSSEDASANILMLTVHTVPDPSGGWPERSPRVSRVYLRLRLNGKEKDKPLKYPDFPTTAPVLDRE